ncbi:urea transporter [Antrihabitans cavernicola]|uniref:urea transporter n=1 Tax=Antrihabitans cavernicola TaxID=2495913 RepID=UPI001BE48EFE|nr:urea transporter [Spelaeibacter cavernicola]
MASETALEPSRPALARNPTGVVAPLLRGLAQVDFMPSALCGAIFAAGPSPSAVPSSRQSRPPRSPASSAPGTYRR